MVRNREKLEHFKNAWSREQIRLNDRIAKGTKVPAHPGQGWLQGEAARYDLCIALFKDPADRPVVCGNKTSSNNYYCNSCVELLEKLQS